jgi:signal peptidase II
MSAMKNKYVVLATTAAIVVILDAITKTFISSTMILHQSYVVIEGFLNITYVRNPGAAFGFLADMSPLFRSIFFISITVVVIFMILYYVMKSKDEEILGIYALSLIVSGATGNLIDRVLFGEVVDFIDVYIGIHHWPAFNVADSAISVGAVLLLVEMFRQKKRDPASSGKNKKAD